MARDKRDNIGCWTMVVVFCLVIMTFLLAVEIWGGLSLGTFEVGTALTGILYLSLSVIVKTDGKSSGSFAYGR